MCTLLGFRRAKMNDASGCSVSKPGTRIIKGIVIFYILMQPHFRLQSEIQLCINLAVVGNGPALGSRVIQLICLTSIFQNATRFTHLCIHCVVQPPSGTTPTHRTKTVGGSFINFSQGRHFYLPSALESYRLEPDVSPPAKVD